MMRTASWLVCAAIALSSTAASAKQDGWTLPVPTGWSDVSDAAATQPGLVEIKHNVEDLGGKVTMTAYTGDSTTILVMLADFAALEPDMATMRGVESGARTTDGKNQGERAYTTADTAYVIDATAHIGTPDAGGHMTRRMTGALHTGGVRSLSIVCIGADAACEPLLASAKIDPTALVPLAQVEADDEPPSYALAAVLGGATALILIVVVVRGRRKRATNRVP